MVDWTAFDAWLSAEGRAPADATRHRAAALEVAAALGDDVAPKHLDALLARCEQEGRAISEIVEFKNAGDDLVRFRRRAASAPPPPVATPEPVLAEPEPGMGGVATPLASLYTVTDARVAASLPIAGLLRAHDPDEGTVVQWLKRYGWIFEGLVVLFGMLLWYLRLRMAFPADVRTLPIARAIGWVGSICVFTGVAGLLRRTAWIDWDALMGDHPFGRMVRRQQSLWVLHTVSVALGLVLLPFVLAAHPSEASSETSAYEVPRWGGPPESGDWMALMRADVPVPTGWQFERHAALDVGGPPWQTAFFSSSADPTATLVVSTSAPLLVPDPQRAVSDRAVALAARLAPELGVAAIDVRCVRPRAPARVAVECTHEASAPGHSISLVCQAGPFLEVCAGWSGVGAIGPARTMLVELTARTSPRDL